jgi:hypothetical protein
MVLTPTPGTQNEDIASGSANAVRNRAISAGKTTVAISAKLLVQASIGISIQSIRIRRVRQSAFSVCTFQRNYRCVV